ncbi:MAG TPA: MgtC/SapB family protein [Terriglobales bacterium]|nr:MgtC/SapB family protein [Terriglobales bacterium]
MPPVVIDLEKLVVAAVLGGIIGLEREAKHRPAGLRTNLFICMGAAMFTMLSDRLAGQHGGDHTRIAAQIIPGIGFIGAGSILHARGDLVTGITTAATIFVVASVGMAVGGGMYVIAVFATLLVVGVLCLLGIIERFLNLKVMVYAYEVTGRSAEEITLRVNATLEPLHSMMQDVQVAPTPGHVRVRFECEGTRKRQAQVLKLLRESGAFESVAALGPVQAE